MSDDITISLNGAEELQRKLETIVRKYPNKTEQSLRKCGNELKKLVEMKTDQEVRTLTGNLKKGYRLDPIQGYGMNMEQNFRSTSKHYHLIERGHNKVTPKYRKGKKLRNGGVSYGFVPGKYIVKRTKESYAYIFPAKMRYAMRNLLKESGLI